VIVENAAQIPPDPSGKFRYVASKVAQERQALL
jgi:hypothetical protein